MLKYFKPFVQFLIFIPNPDQTVWLTKKKNR